MAYRSRKDPAGGGRAETRILGELNGGFGDAKVCLKAPGTVQQLPASREKERRGLAGRFLVCGDWPTPVPTF